MSGLENAALNGDLFRPQRSPSPARSLSSQSDDTDDKLDSDLSRSASPAPVAPNPPNAEQGSRTGPKGVLADRSSRAIAERLARQVERKATIRYQESKALLGSTSHEEDGLRERESLLKESGEEAQAKERRRADRRAELERDKARTADDVMGTEAHDVNGWKRGGLREVGKGGFLHAVERPGWSVVLIYEPDVPRCEALSASMLSLSLSLPTPAPVSLFRARATSLEFSLLTPRDPTDPDELPRADLDVLPTLLVYRDGELEESYIRVDWQVKEDGVEGLLKRQGVLPDTKTLGLGRDDEEEEE